MGHCTQKKSIKLYRYLAWLPGTDWIASFSKQGELVIQSTETGEIICKERIICKEKLNAPADVVLQEYSYIDYNPAEQLLMLGNTRKGYYYIDIYKIK